MNLSGAVPSVQVGDVLIDKTGRGTASKVVSVVTGGGSTTVRTQQATLLDIFEQADIKTNRKLGPSNFSNVQTMLPGVTYKGATAPVANSRTDLSASSYNLPGLGFSFDKTKVIGNGGSLNVNGSVSVQPSVDLDVEIRKFPFPKLTKCDYVSNFATNTSLTITANQDVSFVNKKVLYAVLTGTPITFAVGPIPVVITPVMGLYFQVNSNAKAGLTFSAQDSMTISGGFNWDSDHGLTPVSSFEHNASESLDAYAKMNLEVTAIHPELTFYIYSLKGPYIYLDAPKLSANVDLSPTELDWRINGSVVGGAAFDTEILGVNIALDTSVETASALLASGSYALNRPVPTPAPTPIPIPVPVASLQITPSSASVYTGSYQQFNAQLLDTNGSTVPLSANRLNWISSNINIATIDATGAARGIAPGSVTITATDSVSGKSATASLIVGYGPNVVTNTNDEGFGSLRDAIDYANVIPGTTIEFRIPKNDPGYQNGVFTVPDDYSTSISQDTTFDGTTQTSFTGDTNPNGPEVSVGDIVVDHGTINFKGGVFNYIGDVDVNSVAIFNVSSDATVNWVSGELKGMLNIPSGSTLTLPKPPYSFDGSFCQITGTLNNAGKVVQNGNSDLRHSTSQGDNSGAGHVNNSGTWTLNNSGVEGSVEGSYSTTDAVFANTGTLISIGDCGLDQALVNTGTLTVQSGSLYLAGSTLAAGTLINGAGKVMIGDNGNGVPVNLKGTATVNGTLEINDLLSDANGKLVGSGTVNWAGTIDGTLTSQVANFNWLSGELKGTLNIPSGSTLTLPKSAGSNFYADYYCHITGTLNNAGKVVQNANTLLLYTTYQNYTLGNGNVGNSGTWTLNSSAVSSSYQSTTALFANTGTLISTGECSLDQAFVNTGTLTVQNGSLGLYGSTQTAGSTSLVGGSLEGNLNLKGGVLAGSGNTGTIINSGGTIQPGAGNIGTINVNGDYTQSGTGALELQLGGTASDKFDRLTVSGTATLGGNVNVAYANGFVPVAGDKFAVVTHQTRSGQFTKINAAALPAGRSLSAVYNANDVTLQTIGINPPTLNPTLTPVSPKTNDTLTVAPNGDAASYVYVWKKNGNVIPGESAATLNLTKAGNGDKNDVITCEVTATSASGGVATASAQVTVVNSAPIAISSQGTVDVATEKGFVLNAFDADGDALTFKRVGGPRNGVTADIRVDPADGKTKLFYKSRPFYGGVDIIRFVAFDSDNKQSNESTLGIRVLYTPPPPANRAPIAGDTNIDTYVSKSEVKGLLGSDPDGDAITFRIVGNAKYGRSEIRRDTDGAFKLFYTSLNRFYGNDSVTYIVTDSRGKESNLATVRINFINRSPVAQGNRIGVASGALVSQYLFGTDEDGDALTFRLVNNPRYGKGEVKLDSEGKWRFFYQSLPGYVGSDQITFIAIDPMGRESSVAAIDINVVRVSSSPSAIQSSVTPSGGNS